MVCKRNYQKESLKMSAYGTLNWINLYIIDSLIVPLNNAKFFCLEDREGKLKTSYIQSFLMSIKDDKFDIFEGNRLWTVYVAMTLGDEDDQEKFGGVVEFAPKNFVGRTRSINIDSLDQEPDKIIDQKIFVKDLLNNYE